MLQVVYGRLAADWQIGAMSVCEQLAARIRHLRNERRWTQETLAARASGAGPGLQQSDISHIENARREISLETMCKLARGFGVTLSKLMTGITLDG